MRNQRDIDLYLEKLIQQAEKDIDKVFLARLKALNRRIANLYIKYSKGGEVSWTDINKYNRFRKEIALISQELSKDYQKVFNQINRLMKTTYVENYLRSGFLYEFEAQTAMGYHIPTAEIVKVAIKNPIAKLTLNALMSQHRTEIIRRIDIELTQGFMNGEDYASMAKRIEKAVGFASVKARRVARTEAGRVATEARLKSAEKASQHANLTKVWDATLDLKTRPSHRKLDGKQADSNGYFNYRGMRAKGPHLWGVARMDINCRCAIIFLVNGKLPKLRRARNQDGSTSVIPYQTFYTWYKGLPKAI